MGCDNFDKNIRLCTCTYPGCSKKGRCCECVAYHRSLGEIPGCFFPPDAEATYDRTAEYFAQVIASRAGGK